WRWTVDRTSGKVREEQLDDLPVEFPRVDERVVGRRHRFGFAASFADATATDLGWDDTGLVRYDSLTGVRTRISFGPGRSCGEAVFVPRSTDSAEDDGWYLTLVHDRATDLSELVVLDASAPDQGPVATVHLPTRVPLGFHGNWVPTGT
ncbi:MAG: carotenoid oxygenase family protein, partial [Aquihabitans sp.]